MRSSSTVGQLLAVALILLAVTPAESAPPCPAKLPLPLMADGIPTDDVVCGDPRGQEGFAHMAWQTFKYLVWPAAAARGEADTTRPDGINDMSGPRVFETYKSDWELFPELGAAQSNWNAFSSEVVFCKGYVPAKPALFSDGVVLGSMDKFDSVTLPGGSVGPVLMAQNGSLVRYLAAFNKTAFEHITKLDESINFEPSGSDPNIETTATNGTITIKSAWIEIRNATPDPRGFHVRMAWVQDPYTGECRQAQVALVGLHIVHKTPSSQQWVWASFEHVKNAPLRGARPVAGFTFHNGSSIPMPFAPPSDSLARPPTMAAPYNVERMYDIATAIRNVNEIWQEALRGSVWSNYQLVVVQWPGVPQDSIPPNTLFGKYGIKPSPPCNVFEPGANTANSVMETFLQATPGNAPRDMLNCSGRGDERVLANTCMGCHYRAQNYDFIWSIPLNRRAPHGGSHAVVRDSAISKLRKITGWMAR